MNEVEVILDRPRKLRYDWSALAAFEKEADITVADLFSEAERKIGFHTILYLVWAGIRFENPKITVERVAQILQKWAGEGGDTNQLMAGILSALKNSGLMSFKTDEEPAKVNGDEGNSLPPVTGDTQSSTSSES